MLSSVLSRRFVLAGAAAVACALVGHTTVAQAAPQVVRVGIMAGEDEDVWPIVAANAAKEGLELKLVTFSDYNAPNEALAEHELDANAFQHGPFLDAQNKAKGYNIVPVGHTYVAPIGLYSTRWKSVAALPDKAVVGVPNDPTNEGRALLLLQKLGLIKLAADAGNTPTALDITENPRNISIRELDAGVVGRALTDLDAAVINTDWAKKVGVDIEKTRIAQETADNNPYICIIAVNEADKSAPWVSRLVGAYQQPNVRQALDKAFHGAVLPSWP